MNGDPFSRASDATGPSSPTNGKAPKPMLTPQVQAHIALAMIQDKTKGLAFAATHQLGPAEAQGLRNRLAARADQLFSAQPERLELELAICRKELAHLVHLAESRRSLADLRTAAAICTGGITRFRDRMRRHALGAVRRLPEPIKIRLRNCVRPWR